jgi:prepilin-type N-terminal cleavage/methylation domain-containing protein
LKELTMLSRKAFSLVELMVVILIVGILTAVTISILRGRVDAAKWSEANASASSVRLAVRAYIAEKGENFDFTALIDTLDNCGLTLSFDPTALNGSYFNQQDYRILAVDGSAGTCVIEVTSTNPQGPPGTGTLAANGKWSVAP